MPARRRIPRETRATFPVVRLDIEDLREIERELRKVGDVTIEGADFEDADCVDDLRSLGPVLPPFAMLAREGDYGFRAVTVSLDRREARISREFASEDNPVVDAVYMRLKEIVQARSNQWVQRLALLRHLTWPVVAMLAVGLFAKSRDNDALLRAMAYALCPIVAGQFVGVTAFYRLFSRALSVTRAERPSWWTQHGNSLLVQVVAGIVVLIAGVLIGKLL